MHPHAKRRFSLGSSAASVEPEINLIPFIDVLLVVLIFLMISTTFTRYQELAIPADCQWRSKSVGGEANSYCSQS